MDSPPDTATTEDMSVAPVFEDCLMDASTQEEEEEHFSGNIPLEDPSVSLDSLPSLLELEPAGTDIDVDQLFVGPSLPSFRKEIFNKKHASDGASKDRAGWTASKEQQSGLESLLKVAPEDDLSDSDESVSNFSLASWHTFNLPPVEESSERYDGDEPLATSQNSSTKSNHSQQDEGRFFAHKNRRQDLQKILADIKRKQNNLPLLAPKSMPISTSSMLGYFDRRKRNLDCGISSSKRRGKRGSYKCKICQAKKKNHICTAVELRKLSKSVQVNTCLKISPNEKGDTSIAANRTWVDLCDHSEAAIEKETAPAQDREILANDAWTELCDHVAGDRNEEL